MAQANDDTPHLLIKFMNQGDNRSQEEHEQSLTYPLAVRLDTYYSKKVKQKTINTVNQWNNLPKDRTYYIHPVNNHTNLIHNYENGASNDGNDANDDDIIVD
ncbi:unnamed protein product [Rotaria sp. Silwood2]|nr:unnamed protein product [Rotaria sp. Silwood2]